MYHYQIMSHRRGHTHTPSWGKVVADESNLVATKVITFPWDDVSKCINPISYDIKLTPDLYSKQVRSWSPESLKKTNFIVFHAKEIKITWKARVGIASQRTILFGDRWLNGQLCYKTQKKVKSILIKCYLKCFPFWIYTSRFGIFMRTKI